MTVKHMLVSTAVSALALATVAAMQYPTTSSGQSSNGTPAPPAGFQDGAWVYGQARNDAAHFAQQYVKAEREDDRRELRNKMEKALATEFDKQAENQRKEIEDLEKQIRKLRELMDKRREHRSDIINRRMEQLIQDAQGLGWNSPGGYRPSTVFGSAWTPSPIAPPMNPSGFGTVAPAQNSTPRGTTAPRP